MSIRLRQTDLLSSNKKLIQEDRVPLLKVEMAEDIFYTVRDELENQLEKLKVRHDKFQDIVKSTNTASNSEFKDLRKGLTKDVKSIDKNLSVIKAGLDMMEKNRSKYSHINDAELDKRKKIVSNMQSSIQDIKNGLDSAAVRRKIEDDENRANREAYNQSSSELGNAATRDNSRYVKEQQMTIKSQIVNQDKSLDHLGSAVDKLHRIGSDINQELGEQNKMLAGLENDIEDANDRMGAVQAALSRLLKTKDGCMIWTIVILFLILVILIALVIWT